MKKIIALLLVFSLTFLLVGCDENKKPYKTASRLMENEQYSEAADAFAALGEYNDSAEKALICKYEYAGVLIENGSFDDAIEVYNDLGEYKDSSEKILLCKYKKADKLLQDKKIAEAIEVFTELGEYGDSQQKVQEIKEEYYFENFGYIIPKFNVVRSDAECSKKTSDPESDSDFITDVYSYSYTYYGSNSAPEELTEQCTKWVNLIDSVEGVSVSKKYGLYNIELNGEFIGMLMFIDSLGQVGITISLVNDYT